jgi:hypothetical protein
MRIQEVPMVEPISTSIAILAAAKGAYELIKGLKFRTQAREIIEAADARDRTSLFHFESEGKETDKRAVRYGKQQIEALNTIVAMKRVMEKMDLKVSAEDKKVLDGIDVAVTRLTQFNSQAMDLGEVAGTASKATLAATTAYFGATGAVAAFGTASTGAAISSLSGAAAWNATLAWLGGGSIAAGGGGMAAGAVVLGGLVAAPALLIVGYAFSSKGESDLTQAKEFDSRVSQEIYKRYALCNVLLAVRVRLNELAEVLHFVERRAKDAIEDLEKAHGTMQEKVELFRKAMIFVVGVSEIVNTPVLSQDESVSICSESDAVVAKYKTYVPESDMRDAS